jgi:hypothetical protein
MAPVAGAWSNRVHRLETTAGVYAVKELLDPWSEERFGIGWPRRGTSSRRRSPREWPRLADAAARAWVPWAAAFRAARSEVETIAALSWAPAATGLPTR